MPKRQSSELVIRRLYEITNAYEKGFEYQVIELIKMGLERFNLDIGILSNITGTDYEVLYCVVPDDVELNVGDHFEFDSTYCQITCAAKGPVCIEHMGEDDELASHPAYSAFGLESYIGVPIYFEGEVFGTLNFSSPTPYPRKFKEFDIDALNLMVSWIEIELIRREQESQLAELNKELTRLANYDSLTNVINRRGMYAELRKSFNALRRTKGEGIVAMVDIDDFKAINDEYGHQKGDDILAEVAKKISIALREYDVIARYGGEEFLLWMPNSNLRNVESICARIMTNLSDITVVPSPITVSIGAYHCELDSFKNADLNKAIDGVIAQADALLYQAKEQGKNKVVSATSVQ
ncbi:diguanylate cyclase [Glaciecola sp. MF2-115]|uniref:sensor domain-containing diguanylate cyclase n=1 Tax=Glaciecola sp. MF2-115 TaxID=3384827 RepID=UPI00399FAAAC